MLLLVILVVQRDATEGDDLRRDPFGEVVERRA